jgi:hypothetical protein
MALAGWQELFQSKSDTHEEGLVQLLAQTAASGHTGRATRKYLRHRCVDLIERAANAILRSFNLAVLSV